MRISDWSSDVCSSDLIDLQYACAHPDFGVGRRAAGEQRATLELFFERIQSLVLPNVQQLLTVFRHERMPVVHTRVAGLTEDGRDVGWRLRSLGFGVSVTDIEAQFLPQVVPLDGEVVFMMTTVVVFLSSEERRVGKECVSPGSSRGWP